MVKLIRLDFDEVVLYELLHRRNEGQALGWAALKTKGTPEAISAYAQQI